jgi:hypothetical protein
VSCMFRCVRLAKEKRRPRGIGHEVSEHKKRMRTVSAVVTFLSVFCIVIVVSFYFEGFFSGSSGVRVPSNGSSLGGSVSDGSLRAVVVDALSGNYSNDEFTGYVNGTLRGAGFSVDFFEGGVVTVDFLERFPSGYKLVIFRVHSARALSSSRELYLFTAEPYASDRYSGEQGFRLVKEAIADDGSRPVFGVNWGFVRRLMAGRFNGSLVVVMGCDGADDPLIAEEFINQGAVGSFRRGNNASGRRSVCG